MPIIDVHTWQYEDEAIAKLHRARAGGAVGVMVLANVAGAPLTDARFAGIWAEIDALALPEDVHPTIPPGLDAMSMADYHLVWSTGFTLDTSLALARMIMDGFFDRYRGLKIIGAQNVLFGTDYPHKNVQMEEIAGLMASLPARDRELIESKNASALFGV